MMSKKCPICRRGIGVYQDYVGGTSFFKCDICGHTGCDFEDMTVFDQITQSPEMLAEDMVYSVGKVWASTLIVDTTFDSYEQAIAATVEKLNEKEVAE